MESLFRKYAAVPNTWKEAQRIFRKISLTLHPDKGGNEKEYQALVSELERYKINFSQPATLDNFYNRTPLEEVVDLKNWLMQNRGTFVSLARSSLIFPRRPLPTKQLEKQFKAKVLLIDTAIAWADEWEKAYKVPKGPNNKHLKLHSNLIASSLLILLVDSGHTCQMTEPSQVLAFISKDLSFPGGVPYVPITDDAFHDATSDRRDEGSEKEKNDLRAQMEKEYQDILQQAKDDAHKASAKQVEEHKEALSRLRQQVKKEKGLRKDAEKEKHRLKQQLAEVGKHERESEERENEVRDSAGEQSSIVSFEDSMDVQIVAFVNHVEHLYTIFDSIFFDPSTLQFSLNDALFQCLMMESEMTKEKARAQTKLSLNKICNRLRGLNATPSEKTKRSGTFLSYVELCKQLMREKSLTVVPNAIISISAHVISPSPTFILALMQRLREIATGTVNLVLIRCILGIEKTQEFDMYIEQLILWNSRNQLCDEDVSVRGKRKRSKCGRRVNINQQKCSYHLKRIKM